MKDNKLEEEYNDANLIMSKVKGQIGVGATIGKEMHRDYERAKTKRARILTVLNQRRFERMRRKGYDGR